MLHHCKLSLLLLPLHEKVAVLDHSVCHLLSLWTQKMNKTIAIPSGVCSPLEKRGLSMNHYNAGHQSGCQQGSGSCCHRVERQGNRYQDYYLHMNHHGAWSPGMLWAVLDGTPQDQRGLEKVQGKAPTMRGRVSTLPSQSGKVKAREVRMEIHETMKSGSLATPVFH